MGVQCPYCRSRKTKVVYQQQEEDGSIFKRYQCEKCGKVFLVLESAWVDKDGKKKVKRIKMKALKLPIEVKLPDGRKVYITKEDLDREHNNYESLYKAFGIMIPHFYDDEYVYYVRDYEIKVDKYYVALYCDGMPYARKRLY